RAATGFARRAARGSATVTRRPGRDRCPAPARPVLFGPVVSTVYRGPLGAGTLYSAAAPAGRWVLSGRGTGAPSPAPAFGWAGQYRVERPTAATLRFDGGAIPALSLAWSL